MGQQYFATAADMARLDELAVKAGLEIRQMMELAGWHILQIFERLKISPRAKVTVVCGKGNKGGDGLAAARHLTNHGFHTTVVLISSTLSLDAVHHLRLLRKMEVPVVVYERQKAIAHQRISYRDVLVDALIGYRLRGVPEGVYAEAVTLMNRSPATVVAYDIPTGVDATTGECHYPCILAEATLTLGLLKRAFKVPQAKRHAGKIFLADIGIPEAVYNKIALGSRPPFGQGKTGVLEL